MKNNRVNAYTMLELLITMIITSVVISALYAFFWMLSNRYAIFEQNELEVANLNMFKNTLKRDFYESNYLKHSQNILVCEKANDKIRYIFFDKFIIRKSQDNIVDTIGIEVKKLTPFLINNDNEDVLKELKLEVGFLGRNLNLIFSKDYEIGVLINRKYQDGN